MGRIQAARQAAVAVASLANGRVVASAESCTAGRIATALASVDGAADMFRGGLVAYQENIKRSMLSVTARSVLCEESADQMARGAASLFGAGATVATTGVAGDDPVDGVAPGSVFIATYVDGETRSTTVSIRASPPDVCDEAARIALELLGRHLSGFDDQVGTT